MSNAVESHTKARRHEERVSHTAVFIGGCLDGQTKVVQFISPGFVGHAAKGPCRVGYGYPEIERHEYRIMWLTQDQEAVVYVIEGMSDDEAMKKLLEKYVGR